MSLLYSVHRAPSCQPAACFMLGWKKISTGDGRSASNTSRGWLYQVIDASYGGRPARFARRVGCWSLECCHVYGRPPHRVVPHQRETNNVVHISSPMMAPPSCSSKFFAAPDRMCWLCRRDSEILRYKHSPNPRSALFTEITFPPNDKERETTASISVVVAELGYLPQRLRRKRRLSSGTEGTETEPNTACRPVYNETTRTWAFRVHADCWDLVACRVSDPVACATAWCKFLISTNWGFHDLPPDSMPSRRPKELLETTTSWGKNYRRTSLQRLDNFDGLATELGLADLPTIYQPRTLSELGLHASNTELVTWPSKANNRFATLPLEILQQVMEYTSTPDFVNLRLASRSIACVSRLDNLPHSFWRSRFAPPFEMGFALPERAAANLDWRGMYFLIRRALSKHCVAFPRMESPLLARLAKRRYWWERLRMVVEM